MFWNLDSLRKNIRKEISAHTVYCITFSGVWDGMLEPNISEHISISTVKHICIFLLSKMKKDYEQLCVRFREVLMQN